MSAIKIPLNELKTYGQPGLTITERLGYGPFTAVGKGKHNNADAILKCTYLPISDNEMEINKKITAAIDHGFEDSQYFVRMRHFFDRRKGPVKIGRCMVTDYVEGESLEKYLLNLGEHRYEFIFSAFLHMLKALRFLHRNGIIYANFNLEDIIITNNEMGEMTIKVIDFGSSIMFDADKPKGYMGRIYNVDPDHAPPETLTLSEYNRLTADTWLLGSALYDVISSKSTTYVLASVAFKKYRLNLKQVVRDYGVNELELPEPIRDSNGNLLNLQNNLRFMLKMLLVVNHKNRSTPEKLLKHHFKG
ncbi:kinase-like domain-containing protein [Syncephalis pseudoplumigaleata]|uniref:Kinase-like domain-containing protein n=1 Tax=Syncephalis pseudoplumigaleata TaxID=1712513 RepID=A0A4P9Z4H9_9FUNG|nr:kinase-like domain-containing protein [Syncephalis pseudoplumigaleata]|eukprot:RKP27484.1 kinase-like domain-containing protein [Syncephalis pseudoplumigaleata]